MNKKLSYRLSAPGGSKWTLRSAIFLVVLLALWFSRHKLLEPVAFLSDKDAVSAYLEPLGLWGPLLYVLILGLQVVTALIPGHALMIAAGYLYGFGGGLTLNLIGAIGASQLAFVIARRTGKPFVSRFIPANIFNRWEGIAEKQGVFFFLICFWFPVIPSNATNYVAGLSSISFWLFLLANLVGRLPGLILVTLIGSHGFELSGPQWGLLVVIGLVVIAGGRYLTAKIERHFVLKGSLE